ncbi:MAG: glycosyltransferase [Candidatus Pacearchaeota archaeon]|jgi:hypothetical protein
MKNKNLPKVTVVMLNYNGLNYLKRTVPRILNLDYPDYEVIIIDNGSTDGSIEFINNLKKVKLIKSPRVGEKNFACNYAVEQAKGEYILLLDNDLLIQNNQVIYDLILGATNLNNFGLYSLSFYNEGEAKSKYYGGFLGYYFIKENKSLELSEIIKKDNITIGFPHGAAVFIKKKVWEEIWGYDEDLVFGGDDTDLGIKSWTQGYKNYLYSKTLQIHIGLPERKDNKKYSIKLKKMFYAHMYTVVKNYSLYNMIYTIIGISIFNFLKSIKQSMFRLKLGPFIAFFQGYYLFIKNLSIALKKRKEIQLRRVIKDDIFLKINPPK